MLTPCLTIFLLRSAPLDFFFPTGLSHSGLICGVLTEQKLLSGASQDEQVGLPSNDEWHSLLCEPPGDLRWAPVVLTYRMVNGDWETTWKRMGGQRDTKNKTS